MNANQQIMRFCSRPRMEIFDIVKQFTDTVVVFLDYDNLVQYVYSLYDGKYVVMDGLIDINKDRKMIMLDVKELATMLIEDVIDYLYYLRYTVKQITGLETFVILFSAIGRSKYHTRVDDSYKANRRLGFYNLKDPVLVYNTQLVFSAKRLAVKIMNELIPLIPCCTSVVLNNWEADFIPKFAESYSTGVLFLTCSNDSDMLQLVSDKHFVWRRILTKKERKDVLVTLDNVVLHMFKGVNPKKYGDHVEKVRKFYSLYKAIMGDPGDNVIGLHRYGPVKTLNTIVKLVGEYNLSEEDLIDDDKLCYKLLNVFDEETTLHVFDNFLLVDFNRICYAFKCYEDIDTVHERLLNIKDKGLITETIQAFNLLPNFRLSNKLHTLLTM